MRSAKGEDDERSIDVEEGEEPSVVPVNLEILMMEEEEEGQRTIWVG